MKVFFDNRIFYLQKYGGISRYFFKLNEELLKLNVQPLICSPINYNVYIKKKPRNVKIHFNIQKKIRFTNKVFEYYNDYFNNYYISQFKPDLMHLTYYQNKIKIKKEKPIIITVYDLIHEKYYKDYKLDKNTSFKQSYLNAADHIICISESTKIDLLNYYKVDHNKVSVVHLGIDNFIQVDSKKERSNFILYVGDRRRYKNFEILISAFSNSKNIKNNYTILCVGGGNFTPLEKENFAKLKILEKIKFCNASDSELIEKYKTASLFVSTSLEEGFGLPPLEAMGCNCKVLVSNIPVYKETLKDFAYFFNPKDMSNLKHMMEEILLNDKENTGRISNAFEHSSSYTWEKCAQKTYEIYNKFK